VGGQDLVHLIADAHRRMERDGRLLIDERDASATKALKFSRFRLKNVLALECDAAMLDFSVRWKKTQK
jgi:hypothetical protein